jgi:hypothetical protein
MSRPAAASCIAILPRYRGRHDHRPERQGLSAEGSSGSSRLRLRHPASDRRPHDFRQSTRTASDPGDGTLGGGTAGTRATEPRQRTTDFTESKASPTEGTLPGTEDFNFNDAARLTPHTRQDVFDPRAKGPPA